MDIDKFVKEVNGLRADEILYLIGNGAAICELGGKVFTYRDGEGVEEPLPRVQGPLTQKELRQWLIEQGR